MAATKPARPASAGDAGGARAAVSDPVIAAAWAYYYENRNQHEVAELLGVSRASIVSYLQQARELGLIQISLNSDFFVANELSLRLSERFKLDEVLVVPGAAPHRGASADHASAAISPLDRVAQGAAVRLPQLLQAGDRLGVAWGRTIFALANKMPRIAINELTVCQMVGSMVSDDGFAAESCSARIASRLNATCVNIHAPAILSNRALANALRAEPSIAHQIALVRSCNKAVFSVGACNDDTLLVASRIVTKAEVHEYVGRGAVAIICGRFVDAQGRHLDGPADDRMIGITLDELRAKSLRMLVASGLDKLDSIRAVLAGGYATHLCIDLQTAQALDAAA